MTINHVARSRLTGFTRGLSRKVSTDTGMHHEPDGTETADIEVTVDLTAIARRLATRAMRSTHGTARYLHGCIVVKAINRVRSKP